MVEFWTGEVKRWLPLHDYTNALKERVCFGFLFRYALTGQTFLQVTVAFVALSSANEQRSLFQSY